MNGQKQESLFIAAKHSKHFLWSKRNVDINEDDETNNNADDNNDDDDVDDGTFINRRCLWL